MAQRARKLEAKNNFSAENGTSDDMNEFEKSFAIKEVLGATDVNGRLQFSIEWEGAGGIVSGLVDAKIVNQKYPQDVIHFYQRNLSFTS